MEILPSNRILEALLREETRKLNLHLPKQRKTLEQLLNEERPSVKAKDDTEIVLDRRMLEKLASLASPSFHGSIRLPIIVLRRPDLGKSTFTILGNRAEQSLVRRILSLAGFATGLSTDDAETVCIYWPHVAELVRGYHSLVVIGFATNDSHL